MEGGREGEREEGREGGGRVGGSGEGVMSSILQQVAVPIHVAKILTYPERVTASNINFLRKLVMNGPDKHPGANFIQQKGQTFKKYI